MNWIHNNTYEEAWVCLYNHDPFDSKEDCLVKINVTNDPTGYHKTEFGFPKINFKPDNLTDECLHYWIALISSGDIIVSSCYRAHPHWMINLRDQIGNYSLDELMLPGTHNSGSYQNYDPRKDNLMNRYIVTQDETIWNQLVYGNRYLDIRVAYQNDTFFITHSVFVSDIPLAKVIEDIKLFLNSTQEIVILDFHRFENGFNGLNSDRIHLKLIQYLENELSSIMIPSSYGYKVSLNTLWKNNRRLYVGYTSYSTEFGFSSEYLFRKVSHQWADADTIHDLEEYFNRTVCKRIRKNLQSSMAQMTPKMAGIFFDRYKGLRVMAQTVNLKVTEWFRERWWHCANIVATDFFHGNNIIEVAIEANKKRWLQMSIY
ncbi:variant-surface-glycoprotein phospholipase C-like [Centruroides sculpturatus]|uniref:variant-surface-glycoprotein phospholipase C-like n=1 Tax=Centruroides sculpturatus TaxID=218467 RepID=UPI000C6DEA8F|nr:variant-surface-glycoprotein phospholipase C-like [Centruroides sculpturatus]